MKIYRTTQPFPELYEVENGPNFKKGEVFLLLKEDTSPENKVNKYHTYSLTSCRKARLVLSNEVVESSEKFFVEMEK